MKKLMIFSVAALAAVACAKTYDTAPAQEQAIGFGTWTENLTKARTPGTSTFAVGDNFAVYGYKDMTTPAPVTVFDGDVVNANEGDPLVWEYSPHRFWDTNYDSYTFFAVSPAEIGTGSSSHNAQTGAITTASISFTGKDNDILVANKTVVVKGSAPYFSNYAKVNMVFNHAASLVDMKVKKAPALSDATVTISSIEFQNIYKEGVLTLVAEDYNTTPVTIEVSDWTNTEKGSYAPVNGVTPVYGENGTSAITADNKFTVSSTDTTFPGSEESYTPTASNIIFNNLVVKPQEFGATGNAESQKLVITYQIAVSGAGSSNTVNEYTSTLYLADFDVIDNQNQNDTKVVSWAPGKHYTFYITIDAHAIEFSGSINDWTTANGYHYLIN